MLWKSLVADIPKLTSPLSISSTTKSIVILQTATEIPFNAYVPTIACVLLCNASLPYPFNTPTSSGTSVIFPDLLSWSQCNITLATPCDSASKNTSMVTATTMFASKKDIGICVSIFLLALYYIV